MKSYRFLLMLGLLAGGSSLQAQTLPPLGASGPANIPSQASTASAPMAISSTAPIQEIKPVEDDPAGQFWVESDVVLFWMRGQTPPPLVTSSPSGTPYSQAGVLGTNGTTTLFGGSSANTGGRLGGMFNSGYWIDETRTIGIDADFLFLEDKATSFAAASNGTTILARPFFNALTNSGASSVVAYPGISTGGVSARVATTGLIGGGLQLRETLNLGIPNFRLDVVGGYRCYHFSDSLGVSESLTSIGSTGNLIVPGTQIFPTDKFEVSNTFNGADLGLCGVYSYEGFTLQVTGKLAAGINQEEINIFGNTTIKVPGSTTVNSPGGLLALTTNIGHHGNKQGTIIPELGCKLAYQITDQVRATVGYTLIMWDETARSSSQVTNTINPSYLPGTTGGFGPANPYFGSFQQTGLWIQGLNLGLEFLF